MSSIGSTQICVLAPLATPLPDPPAGEAFTPEQWTTLISIMDTVIPSIRREALSRNNISQYTISDVEYNKTMDHLKKTVAGAPDSEALDMYLEEKPSDNPQFHELLKRTLVAYSRKDVRQNLAFILSALK
jgi:hypothetical protein